MWICFSASLLKIETKCLRVFLFATEAPKATVLVTARIRDGRQDLLQVETAKRVQKQGGGEYRNLQYI